MRGQLAILGAAGLALGACATNSDDTDGGNLDGGRQRPPCAVDHYDSIATAFGLTVGMPYIGQAAICPITDKDFYKFDVPAGQPLVTIEVGYPMGATTPVELTYSLFESATSTTPISSVADMVAGDNRSSLKRVHYLNPGTYYMVVRDVGDDEQDLLNNYNVSLTTAPDNDPNEPNENCAQARPLGAMGTGAISFLNDRDAYLISVPAGVRIVDVTVTSPAPTPVDLRASLYDATGNRFLNSATDPRGEDGPANVRLRYGLQSTGGNYCLIISDDDGADADPMMTYTVTMQVVAEPDQNEQAQRNDLPITAIDLGATGGQRTGIVASLGDLDWYRVTTPVGQIIEIDLSCPGCRIQPSLNLVYADTESPCDADSPCDFLLRPDSCNLDTDCASKVCRTVPGGARRCAMDCADNLDCSSFQCQLTNPINACVGSAFCTQGQCGVLQYTVQADTNGTIRTAQPAKAAVTYILIHDFQDDEFTDLPYNLSVRVVADPDRSEPNNFYFPYTNVEAGDLYRRGRRSATNTPWQARAATGSGCISYQGDIDIFRITGGNPCTGSSTVSGVNCGLQLDFTRPVNNQLDLAFFVNDSGMGTVSSFSTSSPELNMESTFGDDACRPGMGGGECLLYRTSDTGDYYVVVRHIGQDLWDTSMNGCYTWTLRAAAAAGCPSSCPTVMNTQCVCM